MRYLRVKNFDEFHQYNNNRQQAGAFTMDQILHLASSVMHEFFGPPRTDKDRSDS